MERYKKQAAEISSLLDEIKRKADNFAEREHSSSYLQDLTHVIEELKEINHFLK
jgi:archaellum component FlaC